MAFPTRRKRQLGWRGHAVVELVITLPLIATVVLGSVELCSLIRTRQAIQATVYECTRVAVRPAATDDDVEARMVEILSQHGISGASLTTTPSHVDKAKRGQPVTVRISAPADVNSLVPLRFYGEEEIESYCVMLKEL